MFNKETKVLIGDDSGEYGVACANVLRKQGFYAITRRKDGRVILDSIQNEQPDVVMMDIALPRMDAIEILEKTRAMAHRPVFIITSAYENTFMERQVMEKGAAYFMLKPFDISSLGSCILSLTAASRSYIRRPLHDNPEIVVTETLHQLGMPTHLKGFHYLRASILACFGDPSMMEGVTKVLYPTIAKQFGSTSTRVERAIRHAIGIAWDKGNPEMFRTLFGRTGKSCKGKPTNSECIALLTDNLRLQYGRNEKKNLGN